MHPIKILAKRYPQISLPVQKGISKTEEYRDYVLRGVPCTRTPEFRFSPEDRLEFHDTKAGRIEVLYLSDREDFVHMIRALCNKCEPVSIPDSMGATILFGLNNWEKINTHMEQYEAEGGEDFVGEFHRFISQKENFKDRLVILSGGPYSNLSHEEVGMSEEEWLEKSREIRLYHELNHFECRTLAPNDIDAIRDEVVADAAGLYHAFGAYDKKLAELFLGIEGETLRENGRLHIYIREESRQEAIRKAKSEIAKIASSAL